MHFYNAMLPHCLLVNVTFVRKYAGKAMGRCCRSKGGICRTFLFLVAFSFLDIVCADVVTVADELSFFKALIDNNISNIILSENLKLNPEFWGSTWAAVNISRNLTVEGYNSGWGELIELDFSFIQSKVVLADNVTFTFQKLGLLNVFSRIQLSYDFFAASPSSATIVWKEVADHLLICMPLDYAVPGWRAVPRLADYPGQQTLTFINGSFCSRSSGHCFSPYIDGWDWAANGNLGYRLVWSNTIHICDGFTTQACIDDLGPDMCYATSLQALLEKRRQQPPPRAPALSTAQLFPEEATTDHGQQVAAGLSTGVKSGIIGGCIIAGALVVITVGALLRHLRRQSSDHPQAPLHTSSSTEKKYGGHVYDDQTRASCITLHDRADVEVGFGSSGDGAADLKDPKMLFATDASYSHDSVQPSIDMISTGVVKFTQTVSLMAPAALCNTTGATNADATAAPERSIFVLNRTYAGAGNVPGPDTLMTVNASLTDGCGGNDSAYTGTQTVSSRQCDSSIIGNVSFPLFMLFRSIVSGYGTSVSNSTSGNNVTVNCNTPSSPPPPPRLKAPLPSSALGDCISSAAAVSADKNGAVQAATGSISVHASSIGGSKRPLVHGSCGGNGLAARELHRAGGNGWAAHRSHQWTSSEAAGVVPTSQSASEVQSAGRYGSSDSTNNNGSSSNSVGVHIAAIAEVKEVPESTGAAAAAAAVPVPVPVPVMTTGGSISVVAAMAVDGLTGTPVTLTADSVVATATNSTVGRRDDDLLLVQEVLRKATGAELAAMDNNSRQQQHQQQQQQRAGDGSTAVVVAAQDIMLGSILGAGSFGKVYRGIWRGMTVAVKVICHDRHNTQESIENELRLSLSFDHRNIVRALSYITCSVDEDGKPTLSMLSRDALPNAPPAHGRQDGWEGTVAGVAGHGAGDFGASSLNTLGFQDGDTAGGAVGNMFAMLCGGDVARTDDTLSHVRGVAETWVVQEFMDRGTLSSFLKQRGMWLSSGSTAAVAAVAADVTTHESQHRNPTFGAVSPLVPPGGEDARSVSVCLTPASCSPAANNDSGKSSMAGSTAHGSPFRQTASQPGALETAVYVAPVDRKGGPTLQLMSQPGSPVSSPFLASDPKPEAHWLIHRSPVEHLQQPAVNAAGYTPHCSYQHHHPLQCPCPDLARVVSCALDVARGLEYMHSRSVCHGDLKPGNILLLEDRNSPWGLVAKLADFGMSRALASDRTHITTRNFGTVSYMCPEVLGSGKVSTSSCIYSYGIILWELVSGRPPYQGMMPGQVIKGVLLEDLRPDFTKLPGVPPWYSDLARRCWDKEPAERPSASLIINELESRLAKL